MNTKFRGLSSSLQSAYTGLLAEMRKMFDYPLLDIYTWATACGEHNRLCREGIYRHAEALACIFDPYILINKGEKLPNVVLDGLSILEAEFGIECSVIDTDALESLGMRSSILWMSFAVDSTCPFLTLPTPKSKRMSIG